MSPHFAAILRDNEREVRIKQAKFFAQEKRLERSAPQSFSERYTSNETNFLQRKKLKQKQKWSKSFESSRKTIIPLQQQHQDYKEPEQEIIPTSFSEETRALVTRLRDQLRYYAQVEIAGKRYLVTKNDLVITPRMRDLKLGDRLNLNRVTELGSKDFTIKGQPYVSEKFYSIKATVVEHSKGPLIVIYKRSPHNRHIKRKTHKQTYTVLRISEVEVNKL